MDLLLLFTVIGGIILTFGYLPQTIKFHETDGDIRGVSATFWGLIASAVSITAINLILNEAPMILVVIQFINAALAIHMLLTVLHFRHRGHTHLFTRKLYLFIKVGIFFGAFVLLAPLEFTQSTATAFIVGAYLIQLFTIVKKKNVQGLSEWLFIFIAVGLGIMALKMFVTEVSIYIIATELVNIVLLLLCASFTIVYKKKHKTQ